MVPAPIALLPWVKAIEGEFARTIFNDPARFHLELDLSAMMRGDYATQMSTGIAAVRSGVLTANELRESLGFNPHAGGQPAGDAERPAVRQVNRRTAADADPGAGIEPGVRPNGKKGKANGKVTMQ